MLGVELVWDILTDSQFNSDAISSAIFLVLPLLEE
jgi:hypothetical protein